ncbi:putative gustatory receptor 28b [Photinus pyralis]|uniref:putative gustatory receptor 28b n=1 Tax=Photinus pyralis TaxID=7054 RepID=UPI001267629D|nr:putative gustatory receptor 28b [Photinus pyralis]
MFYYARLSILFIAIGYVVIQGHVSITIREQIKRGVGLIIELVHFHHHLLTAVMCIFFTNLNGRNLVKVLHGFVAVQEDFQQLGFPINYKKAIPFTYVVNILFILKVIVLVATLFYWEHPHSILYSTLHIAIHALSTMWIFYLLLIKLNIQHLNAIFLTHFEQNHAPSTAKLLLACGDIYAKLFRINDLVNKSFVWQFIVVIPQLFLEILLHTFHMIKVMKYEAKIEGSSIVVDVTYFWILLNIVVPTVLTKNEFNLLVDTIADIGIGMQIVDQECNEVLSRLLLQLYHQRFTFSAKGIFPLDGTLIYSVLGTVITYLVALWQFNMT